ncbi:MAG: Gfo/Idh/MocA family protein, partial [Candidatus Sumerlaeota bacterium]
ERYGCKAYTDYKEMLKDPDVELVSIATPSVEHVDQAVAGIKADKHVFLEKPIAINHTEAKKLKRAQDKCKKKIFCRHNRRFEPAFQHVYEILKSKVIGDPYDIRLSRQSYSRRNDWQTLLSEAGGQLLNWGPHVLDHALIFLDSPIESLWSHMTKKTAAGDAEDTIRIIMKGEKDRTVEVHISAAAAITCDQYVIFGTKGALTCDGQNIRVRYLDPDNKLPRRTVIRGTPPMEGGFNYPDDLQWVEKEFPVAPELDVTTDSIWEYLYYSIRNRRKFPISLDHAIDIMRVVDMVKKGTPYEI